MSNFWIETRSGRRFDLVEPLAEDVDPEDLAHHLSRISRFGGKLDFHYSVAQHSVHVAEQMPARSSVEMLLAALLHDAAEAYVGDVVGPLKCAMRYMHSPHSPYDMIERRVRDAVEERFEICPTFLCRERVKRADLRMLATEKRDLIDTQHSWELRARPYKDFFIVPWDADRAKGKFRRMLTELQALRG